MTRYDEWRLTAPEDATPEDLPRAERIDWLQRQIRAIERGIEDGELKPSAAEMLAAHKADLRAAMRDTDSIKYFAYGG